MENPTPQQQKFAKRVPYMAHGTKGKPAPLGKAIVVGDPQPDGKPNPELVIATKRGVHVEPIKNLPHYNEGTGTVAKVKKRTPRVDGRVIVTKPAPNPAAKSDRGLDEHYKTSIIKSLDKMKRYAFGTGTIAGSRTGHLNSQKVSSPNAWGRLGNKPGTVQFAERRAPLVPPPNPEMSDFDAPMRTTTASTGMTRGFAPRAFRPKPSFSPRRGSFIV